jgi:hypothetical protein
MTKKLPENLRKKSPILYPLRIIFFKNWRFLLQAAEMTVQSAFPPYKRNPQMYGNVNGQA